MARARGRRGWAAAAVLVVLVLASAAAAFVLGFWKADSASSSPRITEIQELGELVVLRVYAADILEDVSDDYKGAWIVRGDALVAVDLQSAKLQSADENAKKLVVLLPQPRVIQPRVDHEKTETYDVSKKLWFNIFAGKSDGFRDEALRKAQEIIEEQASQDEVMQQAREQAELMLANMYRPVGWEIEVVWQDG